MSVMYDFKICKFFFAYYEFNLNKTKSSKCNTISSRWSQVRHDFPFT